MGFDAGKAVEPLDYDFTAFGGGKGTTPEPSTDDVSLFFKSISAIANEVRGMMAEVKGLSEAEEVTEADAAEVLSQMPDDIVGNYQGQMIAAIAGLTHDQPTQENIEKLPYRVLGAYTAWLAGQLRPEQQRPATRR